MNYYFARRTRTEPLTPSEQARDAEEATEVLARRHGAARIGSMLVEGTDRNNVSRPEGPAAGA